MSDYPFGLACQTYSWQLSIKRFAGRVSHMANVAAGAGFTGFEPEIVMLGADWSRASLDRALDTAGLSLAALVLVADWAGECETPDERDLADAAIDAVAGRPDGLLLLVQMPGPDRAQLERRQQRLIAALDAVSGRAEARGVRTSFHPNSPQGSVFRTPADYELLESLLPARVGFTPDTGHIVRGGMDPWTVIREWGRRVDHVHVKDVSADGSWAPTGTGIVDIAVILDDLADRGFSGWVTFEDESPLAESDPDEATRRAGAFVSDLQSARRHRDRQGPP